MCDKLRDHVKGNVSFNYYRDDSLWYLTDSGFKFPVPIEDIGNSTFLAKDRALLFMRYIRKHMAVIKEARNE